MNRNGSSTRTPLAIWRLAASAADRLDDIDLQALSLAGLPASLDEATRALPGGAYTTLRTFGRRRVMRLADHFERLEETARLAGHPLRLERARVTRALAQVLEAYPAADARVRAILDLEQAPGDLYIVAEELRVPAPQDYTQGVRVVTRTMQRHNPKAKLTQFIDKAAQVRQNLPPGINEAVMIGVDGHVLEGLSSNFFAVLDGVIWTADEGVLSGITRSFVLEVIHELLLPLRLEGIAVSDLGNLKEAFITSASRAVLPVTEIDGRPVGSGRPGPITQLLLAGYLEKVEDNLEQIEEPAR